MHNASFSSHYGLVAGAEYCSVLCGCPSSFDLGALNICPHVHWKANRHDLSFRKLHKTFRKLSLLTYFQNLMAGQNGPRGMNAVRAVTEEHEFEPEVVSLLTLGVIIAKGTVLKWRCVILSPAKVCFNYTHPCEGMF